LLWLNDDFLVALPGFIWPCRYVLGDEAFASDSH